MEFAEDTNIEAAAGASAEESEQVIESSAVVADGATEPEVPAEATVDEPEPREVLYCAICSMPPEFCEYGASYDRCLPWITENCPEILLKGCDLDAEVTNKQETLISVMF